VPILTNNQKAIQKMDKTHFSVVSLSDASDEKEYWLSKKPSERLQAMELLRQINYGYDPFTTRLQRILTVTQFPSS
jgi:hypothetical protein